MNRHPFRWDALVFGLFFLAALGQWVVWEQELISPVDLEYIAAAVLIVLGVVGVVGTVISTRADHREAPFAPARDTETDHDQTDEGDPA